VAVERAVRRLAEAPGIGASIEHPQPSFAGARRWQVPGFRNHLIFYREREAELQVLRIVHGARDLEPLFIAEQIEFEP
jgi:toxin ParE1/3/4